MNDQRKVVFFDIDGTLLNKKNEMPQSAKEAVYQLQEKGITVALATGRAPFVFNEIREELNIDTYIGANGAYVVVDGEEIYSTPLKVTKLSKLEEAANRLNHAMVFLNHEGAIANRKGDPYISESLGSLNIPYPPVEINGYHEIEIYQALLFCQENEDHFLEEHSYFDYIRWHQYSIDVLPSGGSKARGIEQVLKNLKLEREHSYAFGDGLNDLEMLQYVGTGVAMGNGREEVKKIAKHITNRVDEDGIYYGLKKVGLL